MTRKFPSMGSLAFLLLMLAPAGDLDAAQRALKAGRPREAISLLGDLAHGEDPRANEIAGRAHYALKEYEAAVEPLLTASDAFPKRKELALLAAYACWWSAKVNPQYARPYLDDARRMAKRAADALVEARIRKEAGDFEGALVLFRKLKSTPPIRKLVAECLDLLGPPKAAREAWARVLDDAIEKQDLLGAFVAAFKARETGRLLAWLDKSIAGSADPLWSRLYRGYTYLEMGLFGKAIPDLRYAVERRPKDNAAKGRLAECLVRHGIKERRDELLVESERLAREVLASEPRDEKSWLAIQLLAWWAWANRDTERIYLLKKYLHGLDPTHKTVGLDYAAMARRLGRYDEAEAVYKTLDEEYPGDTVVLNDYAILFDGRGDRKQAVEYWKRVLDLDPEDKNALENLFTAAWERGDKSAARGYLRRGLVVARREGGRLLLRWQWFSDRLTWAPLGHGG